MNLSGPARLRMSWLGELVTGLFPAVRWLGELRSPRVLRADVIAGVTVALVLVPQSMAYAQLAGMPSYYGLYAGLLPPMVAVLFGSSRQLSTGPVAIVSLLSAAALEPLATAGGEAFVAYAILLALMVGIFQLGLGLLRLGLLVNFLSHPVVIGFTNAAAIIIATSQLDRIFGVTISKGQHHYETVWRTLVAAATDTHLPTLLLAILAFVIMITVRRYRPRVPYVLIAVIVTTLIAWGIDFEKRQVVRVEQVGNNTAYFLLTDQLTLGAGMEELDGQIRAAEARLLALRDGSVEGQKTAEVIDAVHDLDLLRLTRTRRAATARQEMAELKRMQFAFVPATKDEEEGRFYIYSDVPARLKTDGEIWRLSELQADGNLVMHAGGRVVGAVPPGLPEFSSPVLDLKAIPSLLAAAVAIALIGFMEAISIAKAMAARTRQSLDANQELVGQGVANIVGSLFGSFPVSGSFSRSAINISAGAVTGFSSVVAGIVVAITLLWFSPLLYHLPQATLAAVILIAVIGLVNVRSIRHAFQAQWQDGLVAVVTFALTLGFAPHLDRSIMIGVILSLILFLYRTMKPRVVVLSRHSDGLLRDADLYGLERCDNITMIRFDGSLYFANTGYFEDRVMERLVNKPDLRFVIVDSVGINEIDATGEEMLSNLHVRLEGIGVEMLFARLKRQCMDSLQRSHFVDRIGAKYFFRTTEAALDYSWQQLGDQHEVDCPLNVVCPVEPGSDQPGLPQPGGA